MCSLEAFFLIKTGNDTSRSLTSLTLSSPRRTTWPLTFFPTLQGPMLYFSVVGMRFLCSLVANVILFLAFPVAAISSIGCNFETPCAHSGVIDDGSPSPWARDYQGRRVRPQKAKCVFGGYPNLYPKTEYFLPRAWDFVTGQ